MSLVFVAACNDKDDPNDNPLQTIQATGNIIIPEDVPLEKIGTLQVISGIYTHDATPIAEPTINSKSGDRTQSGNL